MQAVHSVSLLHQSSPAHPYTSAPPQARTKAAPTPTRPRVSPAPSAGTGEPPGALQGSKTRYRFSQEAHSTSRPNKAPPDRARLPASSRTTRVAGRREEGFAHQLEGLLAGSNDQRTASPASMRCATLRAVTHTLSLQAHAQRSYMQSNDIYMRRTCCNTPRK